MASSSNPLIETIARHAVPPNASFPEGTGVYYIPNFVTVHEEEYLIRKIQESPTQSWKQLKNRRQALFYIKDITPKNVLLARELPAFVTSYPDVISRLKATEAFESSPHGQPNHIIMNEYCPGQGIMPHEDGPAYHPVVATISLGGHAVFHYFRYAPEGEGDAEDAIGAKESSTTNHGRRIDPKPVLTVLLEPRSVVITTGTLYKTHLHGIRDITEDAFMSATLDSGPRLPDLDVQLDNWDLLADKELRKAISEGKTIPRTTRYSLTCRDVARVSNASKLLGGMGKR
ncbi:uncharacterized protein SCHCODRAFT_02515323 [Schizophyllum commune H4-8]|uniref:Fe2OG dioxygenase domain-containing protein n=1 Tax=Schizophyllum commune (strain H4-8 / FGSC 9210) TaxID=578458 RepID=D8QGC5_SCHCM|nr:uncharacterized protein SCHCODRAFT_02515323 [Schizophyllum commune H4-8]KAI5887992.1 hypothetical protein SCHCODRAFT_02515323 [Schizophyllum commune H4-8]